jgi:hypothetical protein
MYLEYTVRPIRLDQNFLNLLTTPFTVNKSDEAQDVDSTHQEKGY